MKATQDTSGGGWLTMDELRILCETTVKLVEIRQRGCSHLAVENIAVEILGNLCEFLRQQKLRYTPCKFETKP